MKLHFFVATLKARCFYTKAKGTFILENHCVRCLKLGRLCLLVVFHSNPPFCPQIVDASLTHFFLF